MAPADPEPAIGGRAACSIPFQLSRHTIFRPSSAPSFAAYHLQLDPSPSPSPAHSSPVEAEFSRVLLDREGNSDHTHSWLQGLITVNGRISVIWGGEGGLQGGVGSMVECSGNGE